MSLQSSGGNLNGLAQQFLNNPASVLPTNEVLLTFFTTTPTSNNQSISSSINRCKCYISASAAVQYPVDGDLFIDYYDTPTNLLFTEAIALDGAPGISNHTFDIQSRYIRARLVLDSDPTGSGNLGIHVVLRKQHYV